MYSVLALREARLEENNIGGHKNNGYLGYPTDFLLQIAQMITGRVIAGIGIGINTATAPVWQSETSSVKWTGKLVIIEMILNIAGFSLSNWKLLETLVGWPLHNK